MHLLGHLFSLLYEYGASLAVYRVSAEAWVSSDWLLQLLIHFSLFWYECCTGLIKSGWELLSYSVIPMNLCKTVFGSVLTVEQNSLVSLTGHEIFFVC